MGFIFKGRVHCVAQPQVQQLNPEKNLNTYTFFIGAWTCQESAFLTSVLFSQIEMDGIVT